MSSGRLSFIYCSYACECFSTLFCFAFYMRSCRSGTEYLLCVSLQRKSVGIIYGELNSFAVGPLLRGSLGLKGFLRRLSDYGPAPFGWEREHVVVYTAGIQCAACSRGPAACKCQPSAFVHCMTGHLKQLELWECAAKFNKHSA